MAAGRLEFVTSLQWVDVVNGQIQTSTELLPQGVAILHLES
jgi:hypothetical protein